MGKTLDVSYSLTLSVYGVSGAILCRCFFELDPDDIKKRSESNKFNIILLYVA